MRVGTAEGTALFVVTGMDGAGKSTACQGAFTRLAARHRGTRLISIWDSLSGNPFITRPEEVQSYLQSMGSPARIHFLYHAMMLAMEKSLLDSPPLILVDGYWYKYAIAESLNASDLALHARAATLFPVPQGVFVLKPSLSGLKARKTSLSDYENSTSRRVGGSGSQGSEGLEELFRHHSRQWDNLYGTEGEWVEVDADQPPSAIIDIIVRGVEEMLVAASRVHADRLPQAAIHHSTADA